MANNRTQLATEFTQMICDSIDFEEGSKTKPRSPVTHTLSVRIPVGLHRRLVAVKKRKGREATQLVKQSLRVICAVLLEDEDPGTLQLELLDGRD